MLNEFFIGESIICDCMEANLNYVWKGFGGISSSLYCDRRHLILGGQFEMFVGDISVHVYTMFRKSSKIGHKLLVFDYESDVFETYQDNESELLWAIHEMIM